VSFGGTEKETDKTVLLTADNRTQKTLARIIKSGFCEARA